MGGKEEALCEYIKPHTKSYRSVTYIAMMAYSIIDLTNKLNRRWTVVPSIGT